MKDIVVFLITSGLTCQVGERCLDTLKRTDLSKAELFIAQGVSFGPAGAADRLNALLLYAKGRPSVFVHDVIVDDYDWVEKLFKASSKAGSLVTGCLREADESGHTVAGLFPKPSSEAEFITSFPAGGEDYLYIPSVVEGVMAVSDSNALRFDNKVGELYLEMDYSLQAWSAGERVAASTDLMVRHAGRPHRYGPKAFDTAVVESEKSAEKSYDTEFASKWSGFLEGSLLSKEGLEYLSPAFGLHRE
ncbi:MAG: hypothetical protein HQK89_12270 [Nitrospirae bacterium]|nr:hypothetical protein [Nitrospirota bacterium]